MTSPRMSPRIRDFVSIFGLLNEKKRWRVSLSYPLYCGSREFEEPLAGELALRFLEVDVEAAVYTE